MRKLNPSVKAFTIMAVAVLIAFSFSIKWHIIIIAASVFLIAISKPNWKAFAAVIIPVTIAAAAVFMAIYLGGNDSSISSEAESSGFFAASVNVASLYDAIAVGLRMYGYASIGMLFALTTSSNDFMYSLMQQCRIKPKFAYSILAAFNLMGVIQRELKQIKLAYRVRGYKVSIFSFKPAFSALINAIHWSESIAMAMESKGFEGNGARTYYLEEKIRAVDFVFAAVFIAFAVFAVIGL